MWVIGGDNNLGHYQNDVWSSKNGTDWELVNASVPWGNRVTHCVFSFKDKMWMMGGQEISQFGQPGNQVYNDVWNSTDGITWTKIADHAPWAPRGQMGAGVVFQNKMWIIGGGTYNGTRKYYNDVWSSDDGVNWTLENDNAEWGARQYHDIIVFDNKLWIIGGTVDPQNLKDVWYSEDGRYWKELKNTPWPARHASSVFHFDDSVWLLAGNLWNDSWKLVNRDMPFPTSQSHLSELNIDNSTAKISSPEEKEIVINVYPNPTNRYATISLTNPNTPFYMLTIVDIYGTSVYNKKINAKEKETFELSGNSPGVYFVMISSENENYSKKIVFE
jgi:hypothetical protein